ncbi:hypothetical protein ACIBF6_36245 [Streptosporangium amethystogenes]|uniref:hypothetical protein n=1 Tax=Streptosporangium amethystogenes TaxID=2002 RepID=UPI00378F342E
MRFAFDHPVDHPAEQEHRQHLKRRPGHCGEHGGGGQPWHVAGVRRDPSGGLASGRRAQGGRGDTGVGGAHAQIKPGRSTFVDIFSRLT